MHLFKKKKKATCSFLWVFLSFLVTLEHSLDLAQICPHIHLVHDFSFELWTFSPSCPSCLLHVLLRQLGTPLHQSPTFCSPTLLTLLPLGRRRENVLAYPSKIHSLSCLKQSAKSWRISTLQNAELHVRCWKNLRWSYLTSQAASA